MNAKLNRTPYVFVENATLTGFRRATVRVESDGSLSYYVGDSASDRSGYAQLPLFLAPKIVWPTQPLEIGLFHGEGDSRALRELTSFPRTVQGVLEARELLATRTVNGFWYGVQSPATEYGGRDYEAGAEDRALLGVWPASPPPP